MSVLVPRAPPAGSIIRLPPTLNPPPAPYASELGFHLPHVATRIHRPYHHIVPSVVTGQNEICDRIYAFSVVIRLADRVGEVRQTRIFRIEIANHFETVHKAPECGGILNGAEAAGRQIGDRPVKADQLLRILAARWHIRSHLWRRHIGAPNRDHRVELQEVRVPGSLGSHFAVNGPHPTVAESGAQARGRAEGQIDVYRLIPKELGATTFGVECDKARSADRS